MPKKPKDVYELRIALEEMVMDMLLDLPICRAPATAL